MYILVYVCVYIFIHMIQRLKVMIFPIFFLPHFQAAESRGQSLPPLGRAHGAATAMASHWAYHISRRWYIHKYHIYIHTYIDICTYI